MQKRLELGQNFLSQAGIAARLADVFKKIAVFPVRYCLADIRTGHRHAD